MGSAVSLQHNKKLTTNPPDDISISIELVATCYNNQVVENTYRFNGSLRQMLAFDFRFQSEGINLLTLFDFMADSRFGKVLHVDKIDICISSQSMCNSVFAIRLGIWDQIMKYILSQATNALAIDICDESLYTKNSATIVINGISSDSLSTFNSITSSDAMHTFHIRKTHPVRTLK